MRNFISANNLLTSILLKLMLPVFSYFTKKKNSSERAIKSYICKRENARTYKKDRMSYQVNKPAKGF